MHDMSSHPFNPGDLADRFVGSEQGERSGLDPELGGELRGGDGLRSGLEPELGGPARQKGVYVDEATCIGCRFCAHVARNTFYIEPDYGRSRVIRQDGDSDELIQEAIDTCPVNCIHWVDYAELQRLEEERRYQVLSPVGFPVEKSVIRDRIRAAKRRRQKPPGTSSLGG
jgi:ferredoxin